MLGTSDRLPLCMLTSRNRDMTQICSANELMTCSSKHSFQDIPCCQALIARASPTTSVITCASSYWGSMLSSTPSSIRFSLRYAAKSMQVNYTPSFSTDTPLDSLIKKNAIRDALTILNINEKSKHELKSKRDR